ncbi:LysE family transporter [Actinocorallia sp. B10E7]|uniref:LysE family transporter n=1 Tax=Actinocorallia sp. B10E7 TaxID=3153558 RepID=UPI00325F6E01
MVEALVSGLLAGYGVAVPLGAIGALIMGLSARTSLRVGAAAAAGVATADGLYALAAVLGGAGLSTLIAPIAGPLRLLAALVLLGMAAWTAHGAFQESAGRDVPRLDRSGRAYLALLGLTMLNPMTVVYFAALVLGRQAEDELTGSGEAVFVLAVFAASLSWQLLLACGGALLGRALSGPRARTLTSLAAALIIAVLAVGLIV